MIVPNAAGEALAVVAGSIADLGLAGTAAEEIGYPSTDVAVCRDGFEEKAAVPADSSAAAVLVVGSLARAGRTAAAVGSLAVAAPDSPDPGILVAGVVDLKDGSR